MDQKKMDWHLFWAAGAVVVALSTVIIGCYISTNTRLTRIETVLIMQKIMPLELAVNTEIGHAK